MECGKRVACFFIVFLIVLCSRVYGAPYLAYTGYVQGSSKVIGMGGAFTGIADDVNSIAYNPAGIVFSDFSNFVSLNYVNFIDESFDLNKTSKEDVWKSESTNFGYLHRTKKKNRFTWGAYIDGLYNLTFTNDFGDKSKYLLKIGNPGEKYEIQYSLTRLLFPFVWQISEKLSLGLGASILTSRLSYYHKSDDVYENIYQTSSTFHCDLSAMYKINDKVSLGLLVRPPAYFDIDEKINEQISGFNLFYNMNMPLQINTGAGYRYNKNLIFDFDLHYAEFTGDEILTGSNLISDFDEYQLKTKYALSPHLGGQYQTKLMKKDFFARAGYYYQPALFESLQSKNHFTFSVSWRLIKVPAWFYLMEYISVGASSDIASDYGVQTLTLDANF